MLFDDGLKQKVVICGAGKVGSAIILQLGKIVQWDPDKWDISIIDFGRFNKKNTYVFRGLGDVGGQFKVNAWHRIIRKLFGFKTASAFKCIKAAGASLPGIFKDANIVFVCFNSIQDGILISEFSRNTCEIKLSMEIFKEKIFYNMVEVIQPGYTLNSINFSARDLTDSVKEGCFNKLKHHNHNLDVSAYPLFDLGAAIALQICFNQNINKLAPYYSVRIIQEKIINALGAKGAEPSFRRATEIKFNYDFSLVELFRVIAKNIRHDPNNIILEFCVPLVVRRCCANSSHPIYCGFERQPISDFCKCGSKSNCIKSNTKVNLKDIHDFSLKSLRELYAPAGMPIECYTNDNEKYQFDLIFVPRDVPSLLSDDSKNIKYRLKIWR